MYRRTSELISILRVTIPTLRESGGDRQRSWLKARDVSGQEQCGDLRIQGWAEIGHVCTRCTPGNDRQARNNALPLGEKITEVVMK